MIHHGVEHLVAFNAADFTRYTEISAHTPEAAIQGLSR